jgi:hypothetical protein
MIAMHSRALSGTCLSETVSAVLSPTLRQARHQALNGLGSGTGTPSGGVSDEGSGFGFVAESSGINLWSEYGLHAQLKLWAGARAGTADGAPRYEVPVHGRVVDLVLPDGEIVEIQGSGFGAVQGKALFLARAGFRLRIIYPAIAASIVVRLDPGTGEVVSRRASPKKRDFWSIFDQMVHAPALASTPGIVVEILSVEVEDIRMRDGAGSWRRKGDSLLDRRLKTVGASRVMASSADWLALLPEVESEWTSESLARGIGVPASTAQKILYTFAKAGYLRESGKEGRFKSYRRA